MVITGDAKPLKVVNLDAIYVQKMEAYVEVMHLRMRSGYTAPGTPLIADLSKTPRKVDEYWYRWLGVGRYSIGRQKSTTQIVETHQRPH